MTELREKIAVLLTEALNGWLDDSPPWNCDEDSFGRIAADRVFAHPEISDALKQRERTAKLGHSIGTRS